MNNRFVVPAGLPVDNTTTFTTLQAALTTAGLVTGDTIQIEAGSAPGNVVNADFTTAFAGAAGLTIQGDPAAGAAATPEFTVSDATTIAAGNTLNLKNVNLGLVAAGSLTFNGNANVNGSAIVDVSSSATTAITFGGTTDVLTNSTVAADTAPGDAVIQVNTPAGGSSNVFSGNTFAANASTNAFLAYGNGAGAAVTDQVVDNAFVAHNGAFVNVELVVQESITGLTIQNNTFSGDAGTAIELSGGPQALTPPQNVKVLGNTIHLTYTFSTGILIAGGAPGTTTSGTIGNNIVDTGPTGFGLSVTLNQGTVNLSIHGNDFRDAIGVNIDAFNNSSIAGIDLGGGSQGSLGGNNFRSFTAAASPAAAAIIATATAGTIQAQHNIFAVSNPQTVISATGGVSVNTTALSGNAAYVETLYLDFLHRTGALSNPNDAGGWVTLLGQGVPAGAVANAIARSPEALGVDVDGLYRRFLGRDADPAGRAGFVAYLQAGGTLEGVSQAILASAEYQSHLPTDSAFVQSLYQNLLHRMGSSTEVSQWVAVLAQLGRAGVAQQFLSSPEFRAGEVGDDYAQLLHRPPSAAEVNGWAGSRLDLLTMDTLFAAAPEFQVKG
jgi:hypothetical protein